MVTEARNVAEPIVKVEGTRFRRKVKVIKRKSRRPTEKVIPFKEALLLTNQKKENKGCWGKQSWS